MLNNVSKLILACFFVYIQVYCNSNEVYIISFVIYVIIFNSSIYAKSTVIMTGIVERTDIQINGKAQKPLK